MSKNVVVFIEKVENGGKYLLLDFPVKKNNENYFQNFLEQINSDISPDGASMLEIENATFESNKVPREGLYYEIPKQLLQSNIWRENTIVSETNNENNDYLAYKITAEEVEPLNFGNALRYWQFVNNIDIDKPKNLEETIERLNEISNFSKSLKLIAYNVGQGNMNEIHFGDFSFIRFDMGAKNTANIIPVINSVSTKYRRTLNLERILGNKTVKPIRIFVLSHWDIDHYNGLLNIDNISLSEFDLFIVPQQLPNITSKRAFSRIAALNVLSVPMRHRHPIPNATRLQPIFNNRVFRLFRGSKHYNRNKSGLTITAHKNNSDIILTGDIHYDQIKTYLMRYSKGTNQYMVIPHHGGYAGDSSIISSFFNLNEVAISVGNNPWHHPLGHIVNEFNTLVGPSNVRITQTTAIDYTKTI